MMLDFSIPTVPEFKDKVLPESIKPWIFSTGSITEKLKTIRNEVSLTVHFQGLSFPSWWENYQFNLNKSQVLVREITMSAKNSLCWYARTLVPEQTLNTKKNFFKQLDNHSLGDLLFSDRDIRRVDLCYYYANKTEIEYYWLSQHANLSPECGCWVRRQCYLISNHPFYLYEIFNPLFVASLND